MDETMKNLLDGVNAHYIHRKQAESLLDRQPTEAREHFTLAVHALLGRPSYAIPLITGGGEGGVRWQPYIDMNGRVKALLMGCYVGIAKSWMVQKHPEEALAWLEEVRVLNHNTRFTLKDARFEWQRYHLDLPDMTLQRVTALAYASDIFKSLGNTGTAVDRRGNTSHENLGEHHQTSALRELLSVGKLFDVIALRHPDPTLTSKLKVEYPSLQVYGSWKKLSLKKNGGMKARLGFTSFIWNGYLYVGGGGGETKGPWFRDLWRLDLKALDTWKPLPPNPYSEDTTGIWLGWNMKVYKDKAYLFTGRSELQVFDLKTEKWDLVKSTYTMTDADIEAGVDAKRKEPWPYPVWNCQGSTQQVVGDKLYVFGGTHGMTIMGCNLFMELDLKTMRWRRLSGTVNAGLTADYSCPGPRHDASSWVDRDQKRIYLIFGECDRTAAKMRNEPHYAEMGFAYEDFWSWDIENEKWRLERLAGNVPCPRSEAACVYNESLDKTFIFGGYNPALMTKTDRGVFPFTYYGDTFMYCPSETTPSGVTKPKWKQVLTRGFPTYRAQSQFLTDPDTGKMYLFGGYVNTDAVPSRKDYISRTFGDIWQLRVDMPGGCFDEANLEEEAKTAAIGPWQRCFACGSAGRWKKCGGSCGGKAFFCDSQCLVDGWKDHKKMHGCKKV